MILKDFKHPNTDISWAGQGKVGSKYRAASFTKTEEKS